MYLDIFGVCKKCGVLVSLFRHISATGTTRISLCQGPLAKKCPRCNGKSWELCIEESREVVEVEPCEPDYVEEPDYDDMSYLDNPLFDSAYVDGIDF